jgi:hypothetical protein
MISHANTVVKLDFAAPFRTVVILWVHDEPLIFVWGIVRSRNPPARLGVEIVIKDSAHLTTSMPGTATARTTAART